MFGNDLPGVVCQFLCLGQQIQRLRDIRIGFGMNAEAFLLAELVDEQFSLDVGREPSRSFRPVRLR